MRVLRVTAGNRRAARFRIDPRYIAPLLITCVLLGAHVSFGILESYEKILLAIGASLLAEVALHRLVRGRWPHLASAYVTGISIGILLRSPALWPYALGSLLSITSKYVLRVKGRHLWNPSNFGVCVMFFLAPFAVTPLSIQWGNNLWPMLVIWALGLAILWQVKRLHITATYVAAFFFFAFVRSQASGDPYLAEVAPITGPMYQLFAFFMITDPRTTVSSTKGRCFVAFLVAGVEALLRLGEVIYAPFYALFLVGPLALLVDMWWSRRRARLQAGGGVGGNPLAGS